MAPDDVILSDVTEDVVDDCVESGSNWNEYVHEWTANQDLFICWTGHIISFFIQNSS